MNTDHENDLILAICERFEALCRKSGLAPPARLGLLMDLEHVHELIPLDLEGLAKASDADLAHDVGGIFRHFNRRSLRIEGSFLPRYALEVDPTPDSELDLNPQTNPLADPWD